MIFQSLVQLKETSSDFLFAAHLWVQLLIGFLCFHVLAAAAAAAVVVAYAVRLQVKTVLSLAKVKGQLNEHFA